jgi:hypothetical protein
MKKKIIIAALGIAIASANMLYAGNGDGDKKSNLATTSISGKVTDFKTGETLTGVCIRIENTNIEVFSDFDGNFEIKNLKPGNYNLVTSYVSYKSSSINVATQSKTDFKLEAIDDLK